VPPLSIVIPSHNRPDLLRLCLRSVTRHAPVGTEIIVVDDASRDGAVSAVAACLAGVHILQLPRRGGFCVAANAGVRAATAEFVELLNDDTQVTAGWAEAALRALSQPGVGAVAPLVLAGPNDQQAVPTVDSAGDRYFVGGIAAKRGHGQQLDSSHLQGGPVFGASACSAFYRREAFLEAGGFPESFSAYFEDVDLAFRLHHAGWQIVFEPAARVWHLVSSSYGTFRHDLLAQQSRNEERVFWRNLPRGILLRTLPMHLAVVAGKAWRRWREGSLWPFIYGRLSLLAEIPQLCSHRQRLARHCQSDVSARWRLEEAYWN
jgi:GT2 family glycosyltransferase